MRRIFAAASTFAVVTLLAGAGVAQPTLPYDTALAACRANATKAEDDYTAYKCDWKRLVRGAPGAALTGKFTFKDRYFTGAMTIIEGGGPLALINIATTQKSNGRQCSVKVSGARGANDMLVATSGEDTACAVRIVSSGRNRVRVTATDCQNLCGMGATFEGRYQLQTK